MAYELDDRLKRWVGSVAGETVLSLNAPQAQPQGRGVGLYLLDVQRSSANSTVKPPPLLLTFRYLVTVWAEEPEAAHDLLAQLCFAAMENGEFEMESGAPALDVWRAFGLPPQPGFLLRVPLLRERPRYQAKLVRQSVRVEVVSRVAFYGKVVGPGDEPLPNCSVEVPALGLTTRSDYSGRFQFAGLPAEGNTQFLLRARGHELAVKSEQSFPESRAPMVIRFNSVED